MKLRMLEDVPTAMKPRLSSFDKNSSGLISNSHSAHGGMAAGNYLNKKADGKAQGSFRGIHRKDALSGSESQNINQSGLAVLRKKRILAQVCYLVGFPHGLILHI